MRIRDTVGVDDVALFIVGVMLAAIYCYENKGVDAVDFIMVLSVSLMCTGMMEPALRINGVLE